MKMKNITLQLISAIVIISLTVGIVVGAITLQRSNALLESEIDEKILSTTEKYANGLSGKFSHIEGLVDSLAGTVTATFKPTENLEKAVRHYEAQIDPVVRESISATQLAHGLYVTFNPNFAKDNYEVWYSHQGEEVKKINADFMNNKRDFSEPPEEDMKYFFAPIYAQRGTWTGPYYDKDVDLTVLSYSKGIYVDQVFVGVAGADITADTTLDLVEEMNVYSEGYAFLLDENLDAVVPPKGTIPVEKIKNEEPSGLAYYDSEGKAMVMAYAQLNNGWVLGITQPKSQAYQPIYTLKWIFGGILLIAAMIIVVVAAFFSRAFSRPIE
ncbi:MAG: hypothetical protein RR661_05545, partial [Anaerovoracaceae bacterium]